MEVRGAYRRLPTNGGERGSENGGERGSENGGLSKMVVKEAVDY
jgi:hypothetical protein